MCVDTQGESNNAERGEDRQLHHGADASTLIFRLRKLVSPVYQRLFHSERTILQAAWTTVAKYFSESQTTCSSVLNAANESLRKLVHPEMLFTYVLLLSPLQDGDLICDYGSTLISQYVSGYARVMVDAIREQERSTFYTSYKVLRIMFIAQRYLEICEPVCALVAGKRDISPPQEVPDDILDQRYTR